LDIHNFTKQMLPQAKAYDKLKIRLATRFASYDEPSFTLFFLSSGKKLVEYQHNLLPIL